MNNLTRLGRALILGVVDGLLAGGAAYLVVYLAHDPDSHGSLVVVWWALPADGSLVAGIASVLVHTLIARRVKSILALWQLVGVVSVLCGYLLFMGRFILYEFQYFHLSHWVSIGAGGLILSLMALVATFNLLYALFIKLVLSQYSPTRNIELP